MPELDSWQPLLTPLFPSCPASSRLANPAGSTFRINPESHYLPRPLPARQAVFLPLRGSTGSLPRVAHGFTPLQMGLDSGALMVLWVPNWKALPGPQVKAKVLTLAFEAGPSCPSPINPTLCPTQGPRRCPAPRAFAFALPSRGRVRPSPLPTPAPRCFFPWADPDHLLHPLHSGFQRESNHCSLRCHPAPVI